MSLKTNDQDHEVLNLLSTETSISILKLSELGFRVGTIRGSLQRLVSKGNVSRQWVGNGRFGCYEYRRRESGMVRVTKAQAAA